MGEGKTKVEKINETTESSNLGNNNLKSNIMSQKRNNINSISNNNSNSNNPSSSSNRSNIWRRRINRQSKLW